MDRRVQKLKDWTNLFEMLETKVERGKFLLEDSFGTFKVKQKRQLEMKKFTPKF